MENPGTSIHFTGLLLVFLGCPFLFAEVSDVHVLLDDPNLEHDHHPDMDLSLTQLQARKIISLSLFIHEDGFHIHDRLQILNKVVKSLIVYSVPPSALQNVVFDGHDTRMAP